MGVLDDAIREHLDLKRRQGARENEIKELEDEAFGLPSRPGEPDFPERKPGETGEQAPAQQGTEEAATEAVVEAPEESPAEEEDVVAPEPEAPEDEAPEPEAPQAPPEPEAEEHELVGVETREWTPPDVIDEEPEPAEPAAEQEEHPAEEGAEAEAAPAEPPVEEPASFESDLGVDELDLGLDDEDIPEPDVPSGTSEPAEVEEEDEDGEGESEGRWEEDEDFEDDDVEDVLEETPEFLRDAPGSDDLWFEQGEPKDFDFEDEED